MKKACGELCGNTIPRAPSEFGEEVYRSKRREKNTAALEEEEEEEGTKERMKRNGGRRRGTVQWLKRRKGETERVEHSQRGEKVRSGLP